MGFNLEKYIKGSAKDAFSRMSEDASNQLRDAAINSVTKTFGGALKKLGFSNKIVSSLTSKMADAAQAELAERFFKKANPEINRIPAANGEGVRQNRVKGSQETVNQFQQIIGKGYGASTSSYPTERGYYYCQLTFYNYSRPNAHDNGTLEPKSIIYLPLPAGETLSERQSLKLTNTDLGTGGAVGDMVATGQVGAGDIAGAATPAVERVISKLGNAAIDGAGDALVNFAQQAFAYAPNPHTSVMFQGVNLRSHQFSWRLSPETPTESVKAAEIARLLRFYSLPVFFNDTTALFSYPMICKVKFFAGDKEHPYLKNFTKYCMVEEVVVNYAPNGVPSFFSGTDAPTSIQLGLQLREIEYFTAESYGTAEEIEALGRDRSAADELGALADSFGSTEEPETPPTAAEDPKFRARYAQPTTTDIAQWVATQSGKQGGDVLQKTFQDPNAAGFVVETQYIKTPYSGSILTGLNPDLQTPGQYLRKDKTGADSLPGNSFYIKVRRYNPDTKQDTGWQWVNSAVYANDGEGVQNLVNAGVSAGLIKSSHGQ